MWGWIAGKALSFGIGKLVGAGLIALAVGGLGIYVWSLQVDRDAAEARAAQLGAHLTRATDAAQANFDAYLAVKNETAMTIATLEAAQKKALERASMVAALESEVRNAKRETTGCVPANDDPVAPVLDTALDGLLRRP